MIKHLRLFVLLILSVTLISCSNTVKKATHESNGYYSDFKLLNSSDLENADVKTALEDLGVNTFTAEKLAEPRSDAAEKIYVLTSKDTESGAPRLMLTSMNTTSGALISVDVIWDELPDDRYLDVLGVYFNINLDLNYSDFTDAWISYGGEITEMKPKTDYQLHLVYNKAAAMSYDLGALTKGMEKGKGPLVIHFDVYGLAEEGEFSYNLWAYYDHGTGGYDKDVEIKESKDPTGWQFDIKSDSKMSAVYYKMLAPSLLIYKK